MKITTVGVQSSSFMDFTLPSDFAKHALYYVPLYGQFYCTGDYKVESQQSSLYLLMYVCDGELTVSTGGQTVFAQKDSLILLDGHYEHSYACPSEAQVIWFHFAGNSSETYVDYLAKSRGILFIGDTVLGLKTQVEAIIAHLQQRVPNEHAVSLAIHTILAGLAAPFSALLPNNTILSPVFDYIEHHYHEPVDLDDLADRCNMSVSHLIRSFRKYANSTPHEYLLNYRLRQAKHLLITSAISVEIISEKCGFNSASHFARAFRHSNGLTPTEFRKLYS